MLELSGFQGIYHYYTCIPSNATSLDYSIPFIFQPLCCIVTTVSASGVATVQGFQRAQPDRIPLAPIGASVFYLEHLGAGNFMETPTHR